MDREDEHSKKCRWLRVKLSFCKIGRFNFGLNIRLNPVVSLISALIIWAFVVWCMIKAKEANDQITGWRKWITLKCTWLYIGTQDIWALFIIVLYFSKYSKMKLGKADEKPEFNDATYFTMLFAAGIGIGLFYFGVAEPIYHYEPGHYGNRFYNRYTDNQRAQDAMTVTFFHWGLHAWIVYVIIGLLLAFLGYRRGLPMSMRTCFYPILGEEIYGWMGDVIDILSVVCTMFGVCTSLGLGAIQLNAGFNRMSNKIDFTTTNQIITIWVVTALATASVVSGLKLGIRRLSELCFGVGMFLLLVVLFNDKTWYLFNVFVQSTGCYLQYVIQLGFHTDAFAQLNNAPDKLEAPGWMNDWTIFYWGWWIAWCPFVGMFIAKISRGRTIRQFINATLTAPIIYTFLWLTVFGGAGLRMERDAALANITCSSPLGGKTATESLHGLYRLSCRSKNDMWFDVMDQYGDLGGFLSIVSLIGIILYFVTSSDSGSLVIDCLSANGDPDPPVTQRVFWALTEGATATALLYAGGTDALQALQAVSIAAGLPYTILLCFMCVSLWRAVQVESGEVETDNPHFSTGLLDVVSKPSLQAVFDLIIAVVTPWYPIGQASYKLGGEKGRLWLIILSLAAPFYLWIAFMVAEIWVEGIAYVGWAVLFGFFAIAAATRFRLRERYHIQGNAVEDAFAVMLLYPLAAYQMEQHLHAFPLVDRQTAPGSDHTNETVVNGNAYENAAAMEIGLDSLDLDFNSRL